MTEQHKILLITGVSSGFGRAFAQAALDSGHTVVGTVRNAEAQASFEAVRPGKAVGSRSMSRNFDAIDDAVHDIEERVGAIDVLINNAGYGHEGTLEESPLHEMRRQFDVNVSAPSP